MKYKALSKRFRQAVGVGDPIPASSVLPSAEAAVAAMAAGDAETGAEVMGAKCGGTAEGDARAAETSARNAAMGGDVAGTGPEAGLAAALREAREVFRRSRELISDCECSVASLAAQLARRVDPDYAPEIMTGDTTGIASKERPPGGAARDAPGESRRKRSSA